MKNFISIVKRHILKAVNRILWPWYLAKYKKDIASRKIPSDKLLRKLVYHWGNSGWSADAKFLLVLLEKLDSSRDLMILECGSGLTTVLLGIVCDRQAHRIVSLEHHQKWRARIVSVLAESGIRNSDVLSCPLKSYGSYDWYDISDSKGLSKDSIDIVICDGPPAQTKGARLGLPYVMSSHFNDGCLVMVDDSHRPGEQRIIEDWLSDFPFTVDAALSGPNFKGMIFRSTGVKPTQATERTDC